VVDSLTVFVRPAKDHFELNLFEAKTLSKVYSSNSQHICGDEALFDLPPNNALRMVSRLCGTKTAGIHLGDFSYPDLNAGIKMAAEIVGSRSYKVCAEPNTKELVGKVVENMGPRVNVVSPEVIVWVKRTDDTYRLRLCFPTARTILSRLQPKRFTYFHPGALQPFFCGLMCNLTGCRDGGLLLDPFCGVGSTIIAASKLGLNSVGSDLSKKQVYGCRRNMFQLGLGGVLGVFRADAANLPLKPNTFDAAVFDPPYGRVSSLFGRSFEELMGRTAEALWEVLKPNASACFFVPMGGNTIKDFCSRGFKLTLSYPIRVHSRLTRIVTVVKKVV